MKKKDKKALLRVLKTLAIGQKMLYTGQKMLHTEIHGVRRQLDANDNFVLTPNERQILENGRAGKAVIFLGNPLGLELAKQLAAVCRTQDLKPGDRVVLEVPDETDADHPVPDDERETPERMQVNNN